MAKGEVKELWLWSWTWRRHSSQPPRGVGLDNALQLPKEDLASVVRIFGAPEASAVRRMCGGAAPDPGLAYSGALCCRMR